ncbi:hypothetical protein Cni_G05132 [Canna indica]|uniref:Filament-like plant protein n=1 Tax=Canna indica TaxID=4628 RepID=A0AAQ3JYI2_9LILI|nr:hypothetical protein Cni_G05132 [Canna indica]
MSPRETDCSGSVSSSEMYSDELEASMTSADNSSPNNALLTSNSSKDVEVDETTNSLTEKLSVALVSIRAKEELVKQHAKVAEDALIGWEKSEKEVTSLKQQLKAATQKNSSLEERLGHLDDALKECVRQLRQSREEQEEKFQDAIIKKICEWESHKSKLEAQLIELQTQLEAKTKSHTSFNHELCSKLEIFEKENALLKVELVSLREDLRARTLEMEFSIRAAETASKQHLESIKKVAKLEAECRSLRARTHKPSLPNDNKLISNSLYGESLTDSQSDSAERLFALDNDLSVPDSWASALIAELDQFKNEKINARNLNSPVEIDLMDDFLEMERLASLTEADNGSSCLEHEADLDVAIPRHSSPRSNIESMGQQMAMLEEKIEKMTIEKGEMEASLDKTNGQLKILRDQLIVAEGELVELHRQLNLVSGEKHTLETKLEILEANRKCMELDFESAHKEIRGLKDRMKLLEDEAEIERPLTAEFTKRCENMEAVDSESKEIEIEDVSAYSEIEKSQDNVNLLEEEIEPEKILSEGCSYSYQNIHTLEAKKKQLNPQVESATLEVPQLLDITERKPEKVSSAQLITNCPSVEAVNAKETEIVKLQDKADLLETEVEEETSLSAEFESDIDSLEAKKIELVVQLELEQMEVRSLQEKVHVLEKQIEKEKALTAEFAARCNSLEDELSVKKQADIDQQSAISDESLKIRQELSWMQLKNLTVLQENEVTQAAGRLAKCQETIATLNLQLKSLATLDDFLLQAKTPESSGETKELRGEPKTLDFTDSPEKNR